MAGVKVPILRKTTITLPAVVGPGTAFLPPLAEFVNTLGWVSGTLQVRVYDNSITGATAKVLIVVFNCVVAPEDPSVTLLDIVDDAPPLAMVELPTGTPTEPALFTSYIPTPDATNRPYPAIAESVAVLMLVQADTGTTTGGSITIGVDLIGRDA